MTENALSAKRVDRSGVSPERLAKAELAQKKETPKPFTLVHLTHEFEHVGDLAAVGSELERMLAASDEGNVIAFMELGDAETGLHQAVVELHRQGFSYRKAYEIAHYDIGYPVGHPERNEEDRIGGAVIKNRFLKEYLDLVDTVNDASNGRVKLVIEQPPATLKGVFAELENIRYDMSPDAPPMEEQERLVLERFGLVQRERLQRAAEVISAELSSTDVIGGAGFIGQNDTIVSHILAREKDDNNDRKFAIKRIFANKDGRNLMYDRGTQILRSAIHAPQGHEAAIHGQDNPQDREAVPDFDDPKKKPIHVLNLPHGDMDYTPFMFLDLAIERAREQVQGNAGADTVVVYIEDAVVSEEFSDYVRTLTSAGGNSAKPSDAIAATLYLHTDPPQIFKPEGYMAGLMQVLDKHAQASQGKVSIVVEGHGREIRDLRPPEGTYDFVDTSSLPENPDAAYYDQYRAHIDAIARSREARDEGDAKKMVALAEEKGVGAIVKINGSAHKVGDKLAALGYTVEQTYELEEYIPEPSDALVDKRVTNPEIPLTDEEIRLSIEVFSVYPRLSTDVDGLKRLEWIEEQKELARLQRELEAAQHATEIDRQDDIPGVFTVESESDTWEGRDAEVTSFDETPVILIDGDRTSEVFGQDDRDFRDDGDRDDR
jgi:hypothetical protein